MIKPTRSAIVPSSDLDLDDFRPDEPFPSASLAVSADHSAHAENIIDGIIVTSLLPNSETRGSLTELLTTRDGPIEPIVHVYQVAAAAGSCRAWVYHKHQYDRLAFVNGHFKIALYDIRPRSPTRNTINVFCLGSEQPGLLRIPPLVIHGVKNIGAEAATFVNLPTNAYYPSAPDKSRLPPNDPRIPFSFDE